MSSGVIELEEYLPLRSKWVGPPMEWLSRVTAGWAAQLSRIFLALSREGIKETHSIIFLNNGRFMCLPIYKIVLMIPTWNLHSCFTSLHGEDSSVTGGARKILGWGECPPPSSPGGSASSSLVGMEPQCPDLIFRMHVPEWELRTFFATQSLCQACNSGAQNVFPRCPQIQTSCPKFTGQLWTFLLQSIPYLKLEPPPSSYKGPHQKWKLQTQNFPVT